MALKADVQKILNAQLDKEFDASVVYHGMAIYFEKELLPGIATADVAAVAHPVLRHRVITTFNAEAAGIKSDTLITQLLELLRPGETLDI